MTFDYALDAVKRQATKTGLQLDPLQTITAAQMLQTGKKTSVSITIPGINRKTNQYQY